MSFLLGIDIGKRRTGLAVGDVSSGFVMALDTFHHKTDEALIEKICDVVKLKNISELVIGLPRLPQGGEGEQAKFVQSIAKILGEKTGLPITMLDERYTTKQASGMESDPDARAACDLVSLALDQRKK